MLGLALLAAVWGGLWAFDRPVRMRLIGVMLVWAAVMVLLFVLPEGAPLRASFGGSAAGWLVLGAAFSLALAYREGLRRLRRRAEPTIAAPDGPFAAAEVERYARHILLREIGGPGQAALKSAKVLVVGAGGLGSSALMYLAASGVGVIGVIDDDVVEVSNLQRQIIHTGARLGMAKVFSAEVAMKALNPFVDLRPYRRRFDAQLAADLVADYDLVLDGTDNFDTRYLVNRVCAAAGVPLISGAITQWEGQVSLFDPAQGGPCYECVFPARPLPGMVPTCAEAGVAAPLPGIIGAMMAMEAVKQICGAGEGLRGRLMIHDALYGQTRVIGVKRREGCPACGKA